MPSRLAQSLIDQTDGSMGRFKHNDNISLSTAATVSSGVIQQVGVVQPWTLASTAAVLSMHPCAVWDSLVISVIPGPGTFGRAVTMHTGWGSDATTAPSTLAEFTGLEGYRVHTYGGAGDPGEADRTFNAPFNVNRSDVLKMRYFPIGGRTVFYYFFTESNFGASQAQGDRFILSVKGEFQVYGMN